MNDFDDNLKIGNSENVYSEFWCSNFAKKFKYLEIVNSTKKNQEYWYWNFEKIKKN